MEVIGVVGDTRAGTFEAEGGWIWVPQGQWPAYELIVAARVRGEPEQVMADIKQMVWDNHPELAMAWSGLLEETVYDRWYADTSLYARLLGIFSLLALIMACVGVYGVISYTVVRRSREFGIMLSIGARPIDVIRNVFVQGGRMITIGIFGGLLGAFVLTRLAGSIFYGVDPRDPLIFALSTLLLVAIAGAAIWFPAWRAARINPVEALRVE
jgi:putative ABC transport system permease protein